MKAKLIVGFTSILTGDWTARTRRPILEAIMFTPDLTGHGAIPKDSTRLMRDLTESLIMDDFRKITGADSEDIEGDEMEKACDVYLRAHKINPSEAQLKTFARFMEFFAVA